MGKLIATELDLLTNKISNVGTPTNDFDATTKSYVDTALNNYAKTTDVPTKVSQLINDSGYLTTHQSLDGYVNGLSTSGSGNGVATITKNEKTIVVTKASFLTSGDITNLASKEFVNSSIATATATFRGTKETDNELAFLAWLNALTEKDDNDYVFWATSDAAGNTIYKRYKYDGTGWVFEYELNNSSFTAEQWSAINSGITEAKLTSINNSIAAKQDAITSSNKLAYDLISGTPTIPTVGNGTITITQNGANKGSFTMNQSGNATIALTDNDTTYSSLPANESGTYEASLCTTREKYIWNAKQDALVSGTNIKTINGNSLLGSENITITEGLATIKAGSGYESEIFNGFSSATGDSSHAEGQYTLAEGRYSHTEGLNTVAKDDCSHAQGSFNYYKDLPKTIDVVGIGDENSSRKNAEVTLTTGAKYLINIGGYTGQAIGDAKSLQEVISAYETRIAALESALDGVLTQLQAI